MSKLPSVTIAVSAFNEERNIKSFLESVLAQKENRFRVKQIWVFDDGSSDRTVEVARSVKSAQIKIFNDRQRIGKSSRLNQIYQQLETDFLVQSDADVKFVHPYVVRDILQPLFKNPEVGMCGGHPQPLSAVTFTERAINHTAKVYQKLCSTFKSGNNILSADGRLLAYRRQLVKQIVVPGDMICNDAYTYFCCLNLGWQYRYVPTAKVWYRSPQTLSDQIKQNSRFQASSMRMRRYFPEELVDREYAIPALMLYRNMLIQFSQDPLACFYIFMVNRYTEFLAHMRESRMTAKWEMAYSSKILCSFANKNSYNTAKLNLVNIHLPKPNGSFGVYTAISKLLKQSSITT